MLNRKLEEEIYIVYPHNLLRYMAPASRSTPGHLSYFTCYFPSTPVSLPFCLLLVRDLRNGRDRIVGWQGASVFLINLMDDTFMFTRDI